MFPTGYYGYLYSQVFSTDMYATVFEKDPMDAAAGQRYRREILKPGGSRSVLLSRFPCEAVTHKFITGLC